MVGGLASELVGYAWMIALVGQATAGELGAKLKVAVDMYNVYRYSMDILEVCSWSFLLDIWFALCIGDWYFTLLQVVARFYARFVKRVLLSHAPYQSRAPYQKASKARHPKLPGNYFLSHAKAFHIHFLHADNSLDKDICR